MGEWQWPTNPAVMLVAVFATWYFGKQNLNNARADFEREAAKRGAEDGYFRGSVNERLQSLTDQVGEVRQDQRQVREELREVRGELRGLRGELGEVRIELGEMRGELGHVGERVALLEARGN